MVAVLISSRMATQRPVPDQPTPLAVDRKALRDEISRRYEHTLRRLAR